MTSNCKTMFRSGRKICYYLIFALFIVFMGRNKAFISYKRLHGRTYASLCTRDCSIQKPVSEIESLEENLYKIDRSRVRYIARVTYLGTNYQGWQIQPGYKTIQGSIAKVLTQRFDQKIYPVGASRTDGGVHAQGQVIHFDIPVDREIGCLEFLENSLNRLLPRDIKLYNITKAPPGNEEQRKIGEPFHATKSATGKLYSYRFCTDRYVHPFDHERYTHMYHPIRPLHFPSFLETLQLFVGTHDFSAFGNQLEKKYKEFSSKSVDFSPIRTIHSITLHEEDPKRRLYRIDFQIESALYKMIRNIVGTSFQVGFRKMTVQQAKELLYEAKSRSDNISKAAEPGGLTLEQVYYDYY